MRKHVLFDLDGTLTDPRIGITHSIAHALTYFDRNVDPDTLTWCIGPPLRLTFRQILETDDSATIEEAIKRYRERFADVGLYENEVYAGIPNVLEQLVGRGLDLHLATSKPWPFAKTILEHFGLSPYFRSIQGSELDGTRDAKAEVIRHALDSNWITPESAIMIGDRRQDVVGAKKNGLPCIGVLYGYGDREELAEADAHSETVPGILELALTQVHPQSA